MPQLFPQIWLPRLAKEKKEEEETSGSHFRLFSSPFPIFHVGQFEQVANQSRFHSHVSVVVRLVKYVEKPNE